MFKRVIFSLSFFGVVFGFFWLTTFSLPVLDSRVHGPIIKNKNGTSTNWAGYAAYNSGTANDVKGTWVIPSLSCGSTNTYSSAWVGMDGYNNSTVEQTGTEHDCINGSSSYYAWYEMYPKPGYKVPLALKAGDVINGEVSYQGGTFVLTLVNTTTGQKYIVNQKSSKAQRASAEWIMEAPWSGGVLPLANFGTENFSSSSANMNKVLGTISAFTNDQIQMVNASGSAKATTSLLNTTGDSFSVIWNSSN